MNFIRAFHQQGLGVNPDIYTTPTHSPELNLLYFILFSLKSSISEHYVSAWSADFKQKWCLVFVYLTDIYIQTKPHLYKPLRVKGALCA